MFAQNCWYVAANQEDVTADKPQACQVAGNDLVLYRKKDNKVAALIDRCCHRPAHLSLGRIIEGDDIRCMYHGIATPNGESITGDLWINYDYLLPGVFIKEIL